MHTFTFVILCSLQWASINTCCIWTRSSFPVSTGITHSITPSGALKDQITTSVILLFLQCKKFQPLACFNEKEFKSLNQFLSLSLSLSPLSLSLSLSLQVWYLHLQNPGTRVKPHGHSPSVCCMNHHFSERLINVHSAI